MLTAPVRKPPSWLGPVVGGAAVLGGAALIIATLAEDVATGGAGIVDDPVTIGGGASSISWGWGILTGTVASGF